MRAWILAAVVALGVGQAEAATLEYFGRSLWVEDYIRSSPYQDYTYLGGVISPGLRIVIEIDEALLGSSLTDTTISGNWWSPWVISATSNYSGTSYLGEMAQTNITFSLTFAADGSITDWYVYNGWPGIYGWGSSPLGDSTYDDVWWDGYKIGRAAPGQWGSPVPIPATALLALSAIGGLAGLSARRRFRVHGSTRG